MSSNSDESSRHHPSTYFADRSNQEEMARLTHQDRFVTNGIQNVQTRRSTQEFPSGTPAGRNFAEDMRLGLRVVPFVRKSIQLPDNYDELSQEMLDTMQQPDYVASWSLVTAWGTKTSQPYVK